MAALLKPPADLTVLFPFCGHRSAVEPANDVQLKVGQQHQTSQHQQDETDGRPNDTLHPAFRCRSDLSILIRVLGLCFEPVLGPIPIAVGFAVPRVLVLVALLGVLALISQLSVT